MKEIKSIAATDLGREGREGGRKVQSLEVQFRGRTTKVLTPADERD